MLQSTFARILVALAVLGSGALVLLAQRSAGRSEGLETRLPPRPTAALIGDEKWAPFEERGRVLRAEALGARLDSLKPLWTPKRRRNRWSGESQLYTGDVLERLVANRPDNALAYLALTSEDLFPGSNWNFVFGVASYTDRVGVWSTHRFGDPTESPEAKRLFVRRTLATATHELLHMVGVAHCVAWECLANGINHQEESDAAPVELCPQDLAKLVEATGVDPMMRYERLIEFWKDRDREVQAELRRAREIFTQAGAR